MLNPLRMLTLTLSAALIAVAASTPTAAQAAPDYVWVEAENTASMNFDEFWTGSDRSHLLSEGKLLAARMQRQQIEQMPEGGFQVTYELEVPAAGAYDAWFRVGMENIRAPFEWRVDDGRWRAGPVEKWTTNVMQLARYNDIGWLDVGQIELDAGEATLTVRWRETNPDRNDMFMMLDCMAFVDSEADWQPAGHLKPGERYAGEQDRAAREQVYELPAPEATGQRRNVKLTGLWEVARWDDPNMDHQPWQPVTELPDLDELYWRGIEVPTSQWQIDGLRLGHRAIYRTRIDVPAGYEGRGFKLHFSGTNWLVGVYVNGELAGTHQGVFVPWDMDVSDHIQPGQRNEIVLAIKGPWYAIDYRNYRGGTTLMANRNRPLDNTRGVMWIEPIYPSTKGEGDGRQYGIVNPVTLEATGNAYTEDVFVKPQGGGRPEGLQAEVTIRNTTDQPRTFEVINEAVYDGNDQVEQELETINVTVPANEVVTRQTECRHWNEAKLWWPEPNAHLYRLRTTIRENGQTVDVHEQLFGYRWLSIRGTGFYLNGKRYNTWNWVGVSGRPQTPEQWLEGFRGENNRFTRFSHNRKTRTFLPTREGRLEFYDRNGIPGRLCSMIDGMFGSFDLGRRTRSPLTGEGMIIPNKPLWENWERHIAQMTRAYRNHPSVLVYQVENELIYINGMNRGYDQDSMEELMGDVIDAGRQLDPTRPYTVGGAGDIDCQAEINAPHYPLGSYDWYPENAYTLERIKDKLHMYPPFYNNKPWTVGESLFAAHLERGSLRIGDEAFRSAHDAARGKAKFLRDVYEGYRWGGAAGFYPWDNLSQFDDSLKMFSALNAIPRKRTQRLYGGRDNELLFKIMNDTLHDREVVLQWSYEADGETIAEGRENWRIDPGFGQEHTLKIAAPEVEQRVDGVLKLQVSQPDVESTKTFTDEWSIPILPSVDELDIDANVYVLDPSGKVAGFLKDVGQSFRRIEKLGEIDGRQGLLIVGPDALSAADAYGRELLKFAAAGGRVVVLEQDNPVGGANLPAPLRITAHYGGYAHPKALGTPVFKDLGDNDLIDWSGDHPTYKASYEKPSEGGRALAESGTFLERTPLVEMSAGQGVMLLCQLRVGDKLGVDPAADVLLRNFVEHYAAYQPARGIAALYAPDDRLLVDSVNRTGVNTTRVESVADALDPTQFAVAVIHATAENLTALNRHAGDVQRFQEAGGWIMLSGLEPDGIDAFSELVDADHQIRPFRMERVTLEAPQYRLAATLGNRDLAMYSPEHLQHSKDWISQNVYTYVVDAHTDVSPFTQPPGASENILEYKPTRNDKDPYNYVNDLLVSDHWRYIRQIWLDDEQDHWPFTFRFRRPETIAKVRVWNNDSYGTIEKLSIIVDGDEANAVQTTLPAEDALTEVTFDQPRRVTESITLRVDSYRESPRRSFEGGYLVGINNVEFVRTDGSVPDEPVCLDNVGGLVAYPRGEGGVFLNQVKFMADEPRPVNASKKLNIMGTLLHNMGVGSGTSIVALPGVNVRYEPVSLLDHCTQYLSNREEGRGWFGDGAHDMSLLPTGERRLADDVLYHIVDYATAPVPNCIVLGVRHAPRGLPKKVEGIDVNAKGDLLFFLHTAHVRHPLSPREQEQASDLPEVLKYVVNYADGESVEIPVQLHRQIDHWVQATPEPLPQAQIAATARVPGVDDANQTQLQRLVYQMNAHRYDMPEVDAEKVRGVVYSMQVKNPRPDVTIKSIDVVPGSDAGKAVPAVLGITLGEVRE